MNNMTSRKHAVMGLAMVFLLTLFMGGAWAGQPVRIGYLQADIHQLSCWVAIEKGFYKEQGLDVEVAGIFKAGPEEMSAFAAGELDMGYVGEAPATTAVANGAAKVQVLAQVNTEGSAIMVGKDAAIAKVTQLAGKSVAVPGHSTVQDFLVRKALDQNKVPAGKVKIMVVKPPEMIGALRTKQIDAFIAWEPYPAKARTMGVGKVLITSAKIWPGHPCCVLVADEKFLKDRPDDAMKMVAAHVKATDFINQHPKEALAIGVKYTGMDAKTVGLAMQNVNYTYKISVAGEREYAALLAKQGYIKIKDVDAFIARFLNGKILEAVLAK
jgi:NitT/TauT family transport system substrate-binding protein